MERTPEWSTIDIPVPQYGGVLAKLFLPPEAESSSFFITFRVNVYNNAAGFADRRRVVNCWLTGGGGRNLHIEGLMHTEGQQHSVVIGTGLFQTFPPPPGAPPRGSRELQLRCAKDRDGEDYDVMAYDWMITAIEVGDIAEASDGS